MLDECAPGYEKHLGRHKSIRFEGRTFPRLDSGGHDTKGEIQAAQVAKMVRFLKIDKECAARNLPVLKAYFRR